MKILIAVLFAACQTVDHEPLEQSIGAGITMITIDECEYIFVKRAYGAGLTHKGNCKNHNMVEQRAAQIIDNNNTNCYTQYDIEFIVFGETQE